MKFKNSWSKNKLWDKLNVRIRIGAVDIFTIEIDISREFYLLTVLNFSIKNR